MQNELTQRKYTRVMNAVAAGTTDQTSASVNMGSAGGSGGFTRVVFTALFGALTANQVTSMRGQGSLDDGVVDAFSDLEGTLVGPLLDADGNKMLILEINRPRDEHKYIRVIIDRATANAVIDGVIAEQSNSRITPVTQSTSVMHAKTVAAPAEGTP